MVGLAIGSKASKDYYDGEKKLHTQKKNYFTFLKALQNNHKITQIFSAFLMVPKKSFKKVLHLLIPINMARYMKDKLLKSCFIRILFFNN
jgi:hypothetical protein